MSLDDKDPYEVYGGLQDNSSWVGPSARPGGITNASWENVYGGDGFWTSSTRPTRTRVYAESQGGYIGRIDRKTRRRPRHPAEGRLRREAPLQLEHADPREPDAEGHDLHRRAVPLPLARPRGHLGADLARPDDERPGEAEAGGVGRRHRRQLRRPRCTRRSTRSASRPRTRSVIWVGTDDGNLQLTRDGGKTWTNVVATVPGLPKASWVSWVEASRFDRGRRVRRLRPAHLRRHDAVGLPDHGLRQDLDADRLARAGRPRLRPRRPGGRREAVASLRRDGVRPLDLVDAGRTWAAVQGRRLPERRRARGAGSPARERPRPRDARTRHLDRRRHHAAARARPRRHSAARRPSCRAGRSSSACRARGGWVEGDATFVGRNPPGGRRHHLLPADAPPLRADQARDPRLLGQGRRHPPGDQAPRRQPRRLVHAASSRPACRARRARLRASQGPRVSAGHLHRPADEGRKVNRDEARDRPRPARAATRSRTARPSSRR